MQHVLLAVIDSTDDEVLEELLRVHHEDTATTAAAGELQPITLTCPRNLRQPQALQDMFT